MKRNSPTIPVITGPTGVGKTALSLTIADRAPVEIVSVDSRQLYRELTIGTAKPTEQELGHVLHHFIDECSVFKPDTALSAGAFASLAWKRMEAIVARGNLPLVVGGSTLYLHALQEGLADIPDVPQDVRSEVEADMNRHGPEKMFARLQEVDPAAARTMDSTKTQRVQRALEVFEATGKPLSYFHDQTPTPPFQFDTVVLHRDRDELYDRINRRVDVMLEAGLVDEVKALVREGVDRSAPPLRTIGYREVFDFLDGEIPFEEMRRLIKRNSRRYAKRQLTWFRRYDHYEWIEAPDEVTDETLTKVATHLRALQPFCP